MPSNCICYSCIFRLLSSYSDKIVKTNYFKVNNPKFLETVKFYSSLTPQQALKSLQASEEEDRYEAMQNDSQTLKTFQCKGKAIRTLNGDVAFDDGGGSIQNEKPDAMNKVSE